MLSHDTRLRCDLVDLYFALYGSRRPICLPIPELEGVLKPHKYTGPDIKKIKPNPPPPDIKPNLNISPNKEGVSDIIIDDTLECVNVVEVVARDEKPVIRVRSYFFN